MTDQTRTPDLPSRLREMADQFEMLGRPIGLWRRQVEVLRDAASALEAEYARKDELMRDGTAVPSSTDPATASTDEAPASRQNIA